MGTVLVLLLIAAPPPAQASDVPLQISTDKPSPAAAFVGRPIERNDIFIEGQPTVDPLLVGLIQTRVGSPLNMLMVRDTIAHLYSLGRFQEVRVDATASGLGAVLRYDLIPFHNVQRIDFRGTLGLSEGSLRRAVTDAFGAAPAAARAASVADMLQGYYFDRGYLAAAVRPQIEQRHDPETMILTFEVEAGVRAVIRNVSINGELPEPRARFLGKIAAGPGGPYERVEIQRRLSQYVDRLRRDGRFEASGSHRLQAIADDGRSVDLEIDIDPGPEIVIRYEGDPPPRNRLEELVPLRREGSIDPDIIEDSEGRIAAYLNQQGYWKAAVSTTRRELDSRIELVFTVRRGPRYRVEDGAQISGNAAISLEAMRASEAVQAALDKLRPGEVFIAANLDAASAMIRAMYLRRGYAQVKVESAANELPAVAPAEGRVRPVIVIAEGPLMTVGEIRFSGNASVPAEDLARHLTSVAGQPFYEPAMVADRENILTEYLNRGYSTAAVDVKPAIVDGSRVDLTFAVTEGPQSIVDHVLIVGNVKTDPRVIEREVQLHPGEPLGLNALFETRRRIVGLGLFRRVRITEVAHRETNRRDVLISVEEAPSTTIGYGGGIELSQRLGTGAAGEAEEQLDFAPRAFFEIGRRNLGGRNRSANLYSRMSLRSDVNEAGSNLFGFAEYRVVGTYREPRTFGWNADVTWTAAAEQGVRSAFNFARKGLNAEIQKRFSAQLFRAGDDVPAALTQWPVRATARYTFNTTRTFDERLTEEEQQTIDRIFPQVRLSVVSGSLSVDTRDDAFDPSRGVLLNGEGSIAARRLGGQVGFVKSYLESNVYRRLPGRRRVVFAGRLAVGLADGFPREVQITDPDGTVRTDLIEDLPASERFFAGGDTSIRGFSLDTVGTEQTITASGFPRGGNALLLMNAELRVPVWGDVGAALFVDGGNVFERVTQLDVGNIRGSVGFGVRYRSPIGPLRLDIGFKLDRRQLGGRLESRQAFHFSFGQAF